MSNGGQSTFKVLVTSRISGRLIRSKSRTPHIIGITNFGRPFFQNTRTSRDHHQYKLALRTKSSIRGFKMSFSNLVSDIAFRDAQPDDRSSQISHARTARSHASTAATSVSISGDISSQLHAGYSHPLSRAWQSERQLTKVSMVANFTCYRLLLTLSVGNAYLPSLHHG